MVGSRSLRRRRQGLLVLLELFVLFACDSMARPEVLLGLFGGGVGVEVVGVANRVILQMVIRFTRKTNCSQVCFTTVDRASNNNTETGTPNFLNVFVLSYHGITVLLVLTLPGLG